MNKNPSHSPRFRYHRDVFLCTIFTFFIVLVLKLIFLDSHLNFNVFNPLAQAFKEFELTDIVHSRLQNDQAIIDTNIVIVNIAEGDRQDIAKQLNIVQQFSPKVIGVDVMFFEMKPEAPLGDSLLAMELSKPNVITASSLKMDRNETYTDIVLPAVGLDVPQGHTGYINLVGAEKRTIRYFSPFTSLNQGKRFQSFSVAIMEKFDPAAFMFIQNRHKNPEQINYQPGRFFELDADEISMDNEKLTIIKNKIVLLGYLGPKLGKVSQFDMQLTPLNKSYGGHALPDHYGIEIHAQTLTMMMNHSYIKEPSTFLSFFMSFVICLGHMYMYAYFFAKRHLWFHLVAKLSQFLSSLVIAFLAILVFHFYRVKVNTTMILVPLILAVDAIYFYEAIMNYLRKKFAIISYFTHEH